MPCFAFPFPLHGHFCGFQLLCEQNHDARLGAGLRVGLGCRFSWEMVKSGIVGLCGQDLTWQGSAGANQLLPARTRTHVWSCLASSLHQGRARVAPSRQGSESPSADGVQNLLGAHFPPVCAPW